jgi:hypothetical protein
MSRNYERDYEITAASLNGVSCEELAERYELHVGSIRRIVLENTLFVQRRRNRPIPPGLTVRAALAIEEAIGIWPTVNDVSEIVQRRMEILQSPRGRKPVMLQIDEWVARTERQRLGVHDEPSEL